MGKLVKGREVKGCKDQHERASIKASTVETAGKIL
jgi:hypothetical protein